MPIFSRKPRSSVTQNRLRFQEQTCWAGVIGMSLGFMVGAVWIFTHVFVDQNLLLRSVLGAGILTAGGKLLMDKVYISWLVPFAVRRAQKRGISLNEGDVARLPMVKILCLVAGASTAVAILAAQWGWGDYWILWACMTVGLIMGTLGHWSDTEQHLRARQ